MNIRTSSVKYTRERSTLLEALTQTGGKFHDITAKELSLDFGLATGTPPCNTMERFLEVRSNVGIVDEVW